MKTILLLFTCIVLSSCIDDKTNTKITVIDKSNFYSCFDSTLKKQKIHGIETSIKALNLNENDSIMETISTNLMLSFINELEGVTINKKDSTIKIYHVSDTISAYDIIENLTIKSGVKILKQ